ncbi:MAG TPA: hypothetical protein VEF04_11100 [Blastocatellia bacterium]|nr:hypothetical protein [Blastocatellia bacterium]
MQALLSEVRQLRLALQRSNLNAYHAQVTLERLRLQQQRVDRLNDRLADVRKEIAGHQQTNRLISEQIKNFDTQLGTETDPNKRRELENVKNHHKSLLEQATQGESQARENETLLNSQLQVEQSKLNELNDKLDALQKEVEAVDKQPDGKRQ